MTLIFIFIMLLRLLLSCGDGAVPEDPLAGLVLVEEDPSDAPVEGLDSTWQSRFDQGDALFEGPYREAQGLGPLYIRASCGSCHADDGRGPGLVRKMAVPEAPEVENDLLPWGHTERPYVSGGAVTPLVPPEDPRVWVTTRSPPAVFGRGYLEAVPDATLLELEAEQAAAGRVSGRANRVPCDVEANPESPFFPCEPGETVLGRFGLKARIPTLDAFTADALQGDMGITSPLRPEEPPNPDNLADDALPGVDVDLETVNRLADYARLLALPAPAPMDGETADAEALFADVGCGDCHVPALRTRADWPVPQLADVDAAVYTDLLLHDMGEAFDDGLADHEAGPSEWRTAPLIGLRFLPRFLHDGRAATVEEAILAHGGPGSEAESSVRAFDALAPDDRALLLTYVESR